MKPNKELELAHEFIFNTNKSVFLTGKAGTGKTTFLKQIRQTIPKRMVVVAPTGVAAINAGGVTAHSFFQLPFAPFIPEGEMSAKTAFKFTRDKINLIRSLDLLVIDEVSMLRADQLDAIDAVLRRFKNRSKPFGGTQLLLIGDIQQLSPVVKDEEREFLKEHYDTVYFFGSHALRKLGFIRIELKHIYRQSDHQFIQLLNKVRNRELDLESLNLINQRYLPDFVPDDEEGYITLTTHNSTANTINARHLEKLPGKHYEFKAEIKGEFPAYNYPTDEVIIFKTGAQVMFVKNDASKEKRYYNGKIGMITEIEPDRLWVKCPGENSKILVEAVEWDNIKYQLNVETKEVQESVVGTFKQIPLRLAWAITIHKSQGLTFEKAIIDARSSFAHGQVYVALSRCKSLEGMVLRTPLSLQSIITDQEVATFAQETTEQTPTYEELNEAKMAFTRDLVLELFDWESLRPIIYHLNKISSDFINGNSLLPALNAFDKELVETAGKFRVQLNVMLVNEGIQSELLQTRIKKGATYFAQQIGDEILPPFSNFNPESDQSALKKSFQKLWGELEKRLTVKLACLKEAEKGFAVDRYLKVKTNAELELNPAPITRPQPDTPSSTRGSLFSEIKEWRNSVAALQDMPEFKVLQMKTIAEIVRKLPRNMDQLGAISGIGKIKLKMYGEDLLEIVENFCREKGIKDESPKIEPKKTRLKTDTFQATLDLFNVGKSIQEIAFERKLTPATVESHLHRFIQAGKLDIYKVYNAEKINRIISFLKDRQQELANNNLTLSQLKSMLDEDLTFDEIRATIAYLKKDDYINY